MSAVLRELVRAAEKAACIARASRLEESLFQLLIEEKKEGEKNKKFVTDFKTLTDVLVQEVIKHDLGKKFPGLEKNIAGEESNEFTNELGEKIIVKVCPTEKETAALLRIVLDGNEAASRALAKIVHQDIPLVDPALDKLNVDIPQSIMGMWVDPIDSTYQYIKGSAHAVPHHGIYSNGLQCVTILIGVYDINSGLPLMGVVNQPFAVQEPKTLRWEGQCYWGISYLNTNFHSVPPRTCSGTHEAKLNSTCQQPIGKDHGDVPSKSHRFSAVTSTGEAKSIRTALSDICSENLYFAAGAGYKSLCVVQGLADVYIFSEDTTFKWDSCAPHAILMSLGGGILNWAECLTKISQDQYLGDLPHLLYNVEVEGATGSDRWANKGGLVAFRSKKHLENLLNLLVKKLPL
ncbi:inositol polyphosphate 1-phosphatase [Ambystoma mexicanum]|uniref:inositol polyphosphate 1-phosphatase n=1 Tax=Ambystoma mexicanum TaxID=8296 RepID=UPI0037E927B8